MDKPFKSQIIKLRRKIYDNLKSRALELESHSNELENYLNEQILSATRAFKISDIETIKKEVVESDFTFIGDFHTFDQNTRTVLRLLKFITEAHNDCIVALEMVHAKYQHYIDAYMQKHLTDLEFLESIDYHDSWRFPWTHYKEIFDIAKKKNIKVIGLNTDGTLAQRDQFAAHILSDIKLQNVNSRTIVLYGELHITKEKIPRLVSELQPNSVYTIVHQNLDEIYWDLIELGKEQGIVSFSDSEYCIVSAPPWIKYESMIYWYENLSSDPDFDIHEYIIENGKKVFSDDTDETFLQLSLEITAHLELEFERELIEDFNLYDHTQLDYVENKLQSSLDQESLNLFQYLIETNQSFKIPESNSFYCSSYSMNRIAYLVGSHLFHISLLKRSITKIRNRSTQDKFVYFTFERLYSYFFSKIINPHIKCDMYGDLNILRSKNFTQNRYKKITKELMNSNNASVISSNTSPQDLFEISTILGHILGEYLYRAIATDEGREKLKRKFMEPDIDIKSFFKFKESILKGQDYKNHSKRFF